MRVRGLLFFIVVVGCGRVPDERPKDAGTDAGSRDAGTSKPDAGPPPCGTLIATVRDFRSGIPVDFEVGVSGNDLGIVQSQLGADRKPVYAPAVSSPTTSGKTNFDRWYRDTGGINQAFAVPLPLSATDAGYVLFDSDAFFPIDGRGFGDEGNAHNYHFTTEVHATFAYQGGERFTFKGDDDVWIFINGRLAIDLGGLHQSLSATIDFDQRANALGIVKGQTYTFDAFHAERHTVESNFRIETTIECFVPVMIN